MKSAANKEFEKQQQEEKEKLEAISKKNGGIAVFMLKVPKNDDYTEFAYGFIKYPDRTDISIAMTLTDTDPLKGKEIVLRNSWLEGDEEILNNTELFLSACTVLDDIIGVRRAIVKKN